MSSNRGRPTKAELQQLQREHDEWWASLSPQQQQEWTDWMLRLFEIGLEKVYRDEEQRLLESRA